VIRSSASKLPGDITLAALEGEKRRSLAGKADNLVTIGERGELDRKKAEKISGVDRGEFESGIK